MDYYTHFKKMDSLKLVSILNKESEYNSKAIEAARLEFQSRELTDEELKRIDQQITLQKEKLDSNRQQVNLIKSNFENVVSSLKSWINPYQKKSAFSKIKLVGIILIALSIFNIISRWEIINLTIKSGSFYLLLLESVEILLGFGSGILLLKLKKQGYYLTLFYLSINILASIYVSYETMFSDYYTPDYQLLSLSLNLIIVSIFILSLIFLLSKEARNHFFENNILNEEILDSD